MLAAYARTSCESLNPDEIPTRIGVPAARNRTGVDWITIPAKTAAMGGNLSPTSNGTARAAGVEPGRSFDKGSEEPGHDDRLHATVWRHVMKVTTDRLHRTALLEVFKRSTAAKTMNSSSPAMMAPLRVPPPQRGSVPSSKRGARGSAQDEADGHGRLAGQRRPTSSTPTAATGSKASRGNMVSSTAQPGGDEGERLVGASIGKKRGQQQAEKVGRQRSPGIIVLTKTGENTS